MKKWDKPMSDGIFGEKGINECYIDDIEKLTRKGFSLIFQRKDNTIEIRKIRISSLKQENTFISLGDYGGDECYNCYWNNKNPITGELFYQWKDIDKRSILIWWDHDLGDVVVDSFDPEEDKQLGIAPVDECNYDKVCDEVYFYWIT